MYTSKDDLTPLLYSGKIKKKKKKKSKQRSSRCGAAEMNPTRNHEVAGSIPGLALWVNDLALL